MGGWFVGMGAMDGNVKESDRFLVQWTCNQVEWERSEIGKSISCFGRVSLIMNGELAASTGVDFIYVDS